MTISINQLSSGTGLRIDGNIYIVVDYSHVKPGKGSAFVRVKLKNVLTNSVIARTFRTADRLDDVDIEERDLEYLYQSGDSYHFMDHSTYEEVVISSENLGDVSKFLLENLTAIGLCHNHSVLKIVLPNFIEAKIVETEPGIKGDSTRAGTKPAKIETGTTILVPLFVNTDDWVKIDTRSGQYVERVQK